MKLTRLAAWKKANPEKVKAYSSRYSKTYYAKNKQRILKAVNDWKIKNPTKFRDNQYRAKFGITGSEYDALFTKQNGVCAICKQAETVRHKNGKVYPLCVDHCHSSGCIRGLLCQTCNKGLGNFKDSTLFLMNAVEYLQKA